MRDAGVGLLVVLAVMFAPSARAADPVVQWDAAEQHMGEQAIVEGRVLGVHCSPISCLLAFDPTFNRFTVVVQAKDFTTFPPDDLDNRYSGRRVRVRGTIVDRDRKPEIEVSDPANLKLVETKQDRQDKTAKAADAQDQILAAPRCRPRPRGEPDRAARRAAGQHADADGPDRRPTTRR